MSNYREPAPRPSDQERLEELRAAFKLNPSDVSVLAELGRLELELGELDAATKRFRALLLSNLEGSTLTKADVFYNLGRIEGSRGERARAADMLERALDADGNHTQARELLAILRDDSDIERAAQHHQERVNEQATAAERKAKRDPEWGKKARRTARKEERAEGLAGRLGQWLTYVVALVALVGPIVLPSIVLRGRELSFAVIAAAAIASMFGAFAAFIYTPQLVAPFRLAAVRRLGGGKLDIDEYLEQLCDTWSCAHIEVRIELSKHIEAAKRQAIPDAVMDWVPDLAGVAWDGTTLVITGNDVTTSFMSFGKYANSYPSNREIHDSFATIMRRVVPKLRAAYPIERIGVEIKGARKEPHGPSSS